MLIDSIQHLAKYAKSYGKKNPSAKKCHSRSQSQSTGSKKSFKYREVNLDQKSSDDQIDDITTIVKSLYYNNVHFNSIKTCMYINLKAKSCNGTSMVTKFKVNTGADGNLLPLAEFFKHFPDVNMNQLVRTRDLSTTLYAYINTEVKQLGMCELMLVLYFDLREQNLA